MPSAHKAFPLISRNPGSAERLNAIEHTVRRPDADRGLYCNWRYTKKHIDQGSWPVATGKQPTTVGGVNPL